jgi:hypothetical protein
VRAVTRHWNNQPAPLLARPAVRGSVDPEMRKVRRNDQVTRHARSQTL